MNHSKVVIAYYQSGYRRIYDNFLFSFKMNQSKTLNENLDEFKNLTNDFNQSGEKLGAESKAAILINSLHDIYKEVKSALKYGRESVSIDIVNTALKSKELKLQLEGKNAGGVESLFSKGKNQFKKNFFNKNHKSYRDRPILKCFICHKEGHFKKNCPERGKHYRRDDQQKI